MAQREYGRLINNESYCYLYLSCQGGFVLLWRPKFANMSVVLTHILVLNKYGNIGKTLLSVFELKLNKGFN